MTPLFGHTKPMQQLVQSYAEKRLHHSLILTGPKGVGKKTLALHFMQHVLKHDPQQSPQVFFIQPVFDEKKQKFKRDITLDALSGLTQFLRMTPPMDTPRFVVVSPAEDMNSGTQNALLKILEEPPRNTFFLLLVSHVGALLATIRSRCLLLPVEPLDRPSFTQALEYFVPDADLATAEAYHLMSEGIVGNLLHYAEEGLLGYYEQFCDICVTWREEKQSSAAMQFAESLAGADMEDTADALVQLVLQRLVKLIKDMTRGQKAEAMTNSEATLFAPWYTTHSPQKMITEHERLQRIWDEGQGAYLDRKLVLLSFMRVLSQI